MIKAVALFLIASSLQPAAAQQSENRWLAQDKLLHFCLSSALVSTFYHLHQYEYGDSKHSSEVLAVQITLFFSIGKEIKDPQFSHKDLIADLLGIAVGLLVFVR